MSATLQSIVVMAVHRVVTFGIAVLSAVERSAFAVIEKGKAETVAHGDTK